MSAFSKALRFIPPVRALWISLVVILLWGIYYLNGMGASALALLPIAVVTDLAFQWIRFEKLKLPEAALVTGALLALLFPPSATLFLSGTATVLAIVLKHVLRKSGSPIFNPAVMGVLVGVLFLGLAPSWWVGLGTVGQILIPVLGLFVAWRNLSRWEMVATFFIAYAGIASLYHFFFVQLASPELFLLTIFDPVIIFFGFFMVSEPRSAPADPAFQPMFGAAVGLGSVALSLVLPTIGVLVALLGGNILNLVFRSMTQAPAPVKKKTPLKRDRRLLERWSAPRRVGVGIMALVLLSLVAAAAGPSATPTQLVAVSSTSGGSGGSTPVQVSNCQSDNPSIPASTLTQLHHALGPSVILSYNSNTGVVVFYDPVNHVTVTETDLYEDYGYAEFNGDDYAVNGCSP